MASTFRFENVEVSFSTMLNRIEKAKNGRIFIVKVPMDSPELEELQKSYKELNDKAKEAFNAQLDGKKCKNADMSVFDESPYSEGYVELKFPVYSVNEREVENDDGTKGKKLVESLNPVYEDTKFSYKLGNNGEKIYQTDSGKKWFPASTNIINLTMSLVARYDQKNNRPKIVFKANDVQIVKSDIGNTGNASKKLNFVTLDDTKPVKKQNSDELFSEEEIASLDV